MTDRQQKIAIITDDPGWHGRQLQASLKDHGLVSQCVSLTDCIIAIKDDGPTLSLPGFTSLPLGLFVRGIPDGSLEQVIFRLDILHALHALGNTVYNTPRAIERAVDKPLTSLLLSHSGLPSPITWICESHEHAATILDQETAKGKQLVLKPLFGSQGVGVHLLDKASGLIHDEKFAGIYYLQRFIQQQNNDFTDIRVLVVDGIARAAMLRRGRAWVTNRAQGAICEPLIMDKNIVRLAESACQVLDINYAGVDLMQDKKGQFYIIEVNSMPAWYGLQSVVDFNIAACLVDSFVKQIALNNQLHDCRELS